MCSVISAQPCLFEMPLIASSLPSTIYYSTVPCYPLGCSSQMFLYQQNLFGTICPLKDKYPEMKFINSGMSKVIPARHGSPVQNHMIFQEYQGPTNEFEYIYFHHKQQNPCSSTAFKQLVSCTHALFFALSSLRLVHSNLFILLWSPVYSNSQVQPMFHSSLLPLSGYLKWLQQQADK